MRLAGRLIALAWMCSLLCSAGGKKKPEPYAIIAGTVFQESGFSLRGANVVLTLQGDPKAKKLQGAVSDVRGEFAFHVPAKPAAYMVKAIEKRPRDFVFPRGAALGMGFLRRSPNFLFDWMMDQAGPKALTTEF